jgi:hypothetical protein
MREITDTALQQLYQACRGNAGFPGHLPNDSMGVASTSDILIAMGLLPPAQAGPHVPIEPPQHFSVSNHREVCKSHPRTVPRSRLAVEPSVDLDTESRSLGIPDDEARQLTCSKRSKTREKLDMMAQFEAYAPSRTFSMRPQDAEALRGSYQEPAPPQQEMLELANVPDIDFVSDLSFDCPTLTTSTSPNDYLQLDFSPPTPGPAPDRLECQFPQYSSPTGLNDISLPELDLSTAACDQPCNFDVEINLPCHRCARIWELPPI